VLLQGTTGLSRWGHFLRGQANRGTLSHQGHGGAGKNGLGKNPAECVPGPVRDWSIRGSGLCRTTPGGGYLVYRSSRTGRAGKWASTRDRGPRTVERRTAGPGPGAVKKVNPQFSGAGQLKVVGGNGTSSWGRSRFSWPMGTPQTPLGIGLMSWRRIRDTGLRRVLPLAGPKKKGKGAAGSTGGGEKQGGPGDFVGAPSKEAPGAAKGWKGGRGPVRGILAAPRMYWDHVGGGTVRMRGGGYRWSAFPPQGARATFFMPLRLDGNTTRDERPRAGTGGLDSFAHPRGARPEKLMGGVRGAARGEWASGLSFTGAGGAGGGGYASASHHTKGQAGFCVPEHRGGGGVFFH